MPIIKSAKKSLRQSKRRKARNIKKKDAVKDLVKKIKALLVQKKNEEAKKLLPAIYKALDKAAKTGVIKKSNASRRKSRITKSLSSKS
ncbi:MAG: 30S ribosomal protein S20 [Candidatus Wildermuthbacteria bacterium RIFCSPHIGHO2_12_FULL_40_12]|uniref:Small ribosomal subunit protein bS20 n=1 Tax=Candidatus Wildermuthbacteria bacterium RIFCSPHIGHO2_12_FULL_40_12 TaxID=1802457 RepID=A0A1G2RDA6_9BACT|nr:MAG: 30S ribosomal protein S20 [Candidatus Wildermuthbacteria bacterium RIFCSPHIGHO2_12_FULL_40_12]